MSLTFLERRKLGKIEENTEQTITLLRLMNLKMDRQIRLLEQMVKILKERRNDADY